MEWGMCSEWEKGEKPRLPWNKDGRFLRVYVSRMGVVICNAEKTRAVNDKWFQAFLEANEGNPNLEWAASFERDACENWINE